MAANFVTNYDALAHVFSFFVPPLQVVDEYGRPSLLAAEGRKQLCRLALVCKSFHEPALHCLWSNLPSIRPILEAHPGLEMLDGVYYHRQIVRGNLGKLEKLTQKVRCLRLGEGSIKPVAFATYAWLGQERTSFPLLPALREVCFEGPRGNTEQLGLLSVILSPSIEAIYFRGPFTFSDTFTSYIFPLVCNKAKSAKTLLIHDASSSTYRGVWDVMPKIAGALPLCSLDIRFPKNHTLPSDFLERAAVRFKNLSRLTLDMHTPSHGPSNDTFTVLFPSLISLHLICHSETEICQCYPQSLLERATALTLYLSSSPANANDFDVTVTTLSSMRSLKRLEIKQDPCEAQILIPQSAIPLLIQQLELEELYVDVWGMDAPDNGQSFGWNFLDLEEANLPGGCDRSLRGLSSLGLPIWRPDRYYERNHWEIEQLHPNYPPLATLTSIAKLRDLRQVKLSVDSSTSSSSSFESLLEEWREPTSPSALRHLELADMRPADTTLTVVQCRDIARFLDAIFPNLVSLRMVEEAGRSKMWDGHWEVIEESRKMRQELRLRRSGSA